MGYEVVLVEDVDLAGAAWAIVRDGRGDTFLFVAKAALHRDPAGLLTRVWRAWEVERGRSLVNA